MSQFPSFGNAFAGTTTTYPRRFAGTPTPNLSYEDNPPAPQIYSRDTSQDAPMISSYPRVSVGRSAPIYSSPGGTGGPYPNAPVMPRTQFTEGIRQGQVQTNQNLTIASKLAAPGRSAQFAANAAPPINQDTPADRQATAERQSHMDFTRQQARAVFDSSKPQFSNPDDHQNHFVDTLGKYGIGGDQAKQLYNEFSGNYTTQPSAPIAPSISPNIPLTRGTGRGGIYSTPRGVAAVNDNGGLAGGNFAPAVDGVPKIWNPTAPAPATTPIYKPMQGYTPLEKTPQAQAPLSDSTQAINQRSADRDVQNRTAGRNAYVAGKQAEGDIATGLTAEQNQPRLPVTPQLAVAEARLQGQQQHDKTMDERTVQTIQGRNELADTNNQAKSGIADKNNAAKKDLQGQKLNAQQSAAVEKSAHTLMSNPNWPTDPTTGAPDYNAAIDAAMKMHQKLGTIQATQPTAAATTQPSAAPAGEPAQDDLEFTAQKHGITVDEVKRRMGQ